MSYLNFTQPLKHFTEVAYGTEISMWNAVTSTDGEILYSTDGLNWTICSVPTMSDQIISQIQYGRKFDGTPLFLAQSGTDPSHVKHFLNSVDGINYTLVSTGLGSSRILYGNGWFYNFYYTKAYRSLDGTNWETLGTMPNYNWSRAAYGNNIIVVVGQPSDNTFCISTNFGLTWTTVATPFPVDDVVFNGTKFVACSASQSKIATSGYGTSWSIVNSSTSLEKMTVYYGNIIGIKSGTNTVRTSIDHGTTWTTDTVTSSSTYAAIGTKQGLPLPALFPTPFPTAATPTPTPTMTPTPTPTATPSGILLSNQNNITTSSLAPTTNGYTFQNNPVTGQPLSVAFTQNNTVDEWVNVNLTNNSGETLTVVIDGVTYTVPPGGTFNQTVLLNPGDTVTITGPTGNYPAGAVTGGVGVVPAPTPTPTPTPSGILLSNQSNITASSLAPTTNGYTFQNNPVTGQPLSVAFTQNNTVDEWVNVNLTNNSGETLTVVIDGVTYTVPPGGTFNQTVLLNPGDTVTITGPTGNYPAGAVTGGVGVVPAPTPTPTPTSTPTPTPTMPNNIWFWGNGNAGLLANNLSTGFASYPVQTTTDIKDFSSCIDNPLSFIQGMITTDGKLWVWGANTNGNLGNNSTVDKSSPVQTVAGGTNWSQIDGSNTHVVAIKTDGSLWAWGENLLGQLGQNDKIHRSSPTRIGSGTNWVKCAAGYRTTHALKSDGTIWSCGFNYNGQLGIGNNSDQSILVQTVGSGFSDVKSASAFTAAKKTNNTLWLWGDNYQGQLGINSQNSGTTTPVQEITGSTWDKFALFSTGVAAIKSGNVYSWGQNTQGCLAQGNSAPNNVLIPTAILNNDGTVTNVSCGADTLYVRKSNGTIWGAGTRDNYELDDGVNLPAGVSSLIQVASSKTWTNIFAIANTAIAKETV